MLHHAVLIVHQRDAVSAEILSTLPEEGQDALIDLMSHAAKVMNTKYRP